MNNETYRSGFRIAELTIIDGQSIRTLRWGGIVFIANETVFAGDTIKLSYVIDNIYHVERVQEEADRWLTGIRGAWSASEPVLVLSRTNDNEMVVVVRSGTEVTCYDDGVTVRFLAETFERVDKDEQELRRAVRIITGHGSNK